MTADIPANTVSQADLDEWYSLQQQLASIKAREMLLRTKIFKYFFPTPVEGTNSYELGGGYMMKATHVINREVDPGALGAYREKLVGANISPDALVQYKPSLIISAYRKLTDEQRNIFDNCLIVKPGSPQLKVEQPKQKKEK